MDKLIDLTIQHRIDIRRFVLGSGVFDQPVRVQDVIAYLLTERNVLFCRFEFGGTG